MCVLYVHGCAGVHTCAFVAPCVVWCAHMCLRACVCLHVYVTCSVCVCVHACVYLLLSSVFLTAACSHRHGAACLPRPCKFNPWPGILEETLGRAPCPVAAAARELALTRARWGCSLRPGHHSAGCAEWESPSSTPTPLTVAAGACPWGRRSKRRPSDPRSHCSFSAFKCHSDTRA